MATLPLSPLMVLMSGIQVPPMFALTPTHTSASRLCGGNACARKPDEKANAGE